MSYRGTIIEESLSSTLDLSLFDATIVETNIEPVREAHETPWLTQWTLVTFEVPDENAERLASVLAEMLLSTPGTWYADFKDERSHYVVFPKKVFHVDRTAEGYEIVRRYGLTQAIPKHQLDFSPDIP